jgi:hypothetical protein
MGNLPSNKSRYKRLSKNQASAGHLYVELGGQRAALRNCWTPPHSAMRPRESIKPIVLGLEAVLEIMSNDML